MDEEERNLNINELLINPKDINELRKKYVNEKILDNGNRQAIFYFDKDYNLTDKDNAYYANKFNVISKRRGKKRAYIAIARKILVAIYHMLSTGELFNPSDLSRVETSDKDKIKYTKNNFMQSTKQLISLGITIDELQTFLTSKISESTPVI